VCRWPALAATRAGFDAIHERIHGHAAKEKAVEVVSYRLRVRVTVPKFSPQAREPQARLLPPPQAIKGTRFVYFDADKPVETTIYDRDSLVPGTGFAGPGIVEQFDATTVVTLGWQATVDRYANLILERKG
jgi:N-methylhydantoinase A